ncbi:hypothetical protein D3C76_1728550 [compost metagenome]
MLTDVIDRSHALAPSVVLTRLVRDHGVVGPTALPQFVDHIEKLFGTLIAIIVLDHPLQTEVARGAGQV